MMKDVVISVRSVHGYDRGEEDVTEFTTDGMYSFEEGVACMTYMESEVTGMEGTRTSVIVMPDKIAVDRDGSITSRMILQEGGKNTFQYDTPYGKAIMGVEARTIRHSFDENGGSMELDFVVDMEHTVVTRSKLSVTVREQKFGGTANG